MTALEFRAVIRRGLNARFRSWRHHILDINLKAVLQCAAATHWVRCDHSDGRPAQVAYIYDDVANFSRLQRKAVELDFEWDPGELATAELFFQAPQKTEIVL